MDMDAVRQVSLTVWGHKQGEMVSLMIHLGHRLDLYTALDGAGPLPPTSSPTARTCIRAGCWSGCTRRLPARS